MTGFDAVPGAPCSTDQGLLGRLAEDLERLGYTVDGVASLVGDEAYAALNRDQPVPALLGCRRLAAQPGDAGRLAAVVLLWLLGETLPGAQLEAALPTTGVDGLLRLGLVERHPGCAGDDDDDDGSRTARSHPAQFRAQQFRAAADLRPHSSDADGDLWVASDVGANQRPGVLRADHVLGIGQASLTLAQATVRPTVERALGLGTGCGIQTFHLLAHAAHVTATDISARALAFTRFNLLLNARQLRLDPEDLGARVSLRQGSMLEPVAGEEFDLVVSNPPFVITPRHREEEPAEQFTYRDGGLAGDSIVAGLVRDLPSVLAPGGMAQLLGNWEIPAGTDWRARVEQWLAGGTDAWFIQRERITPAHYAETWLRDAAEDRDKAHYEQRYGDYLADFAARGTEAVGFGMIWLRRRKPPQSAVRRFEEVSHEIEQPVGPHLAAAVKRSDWLAVRTGDFENQHLSVAADVTQERHQRPGAEHPGVILLRQGAGLRRTTLLNTELAGFASACDGELTAGQIAGALAALLDRDDHGFRPGLLAEVRNLVMDGFLVPADAGASG
jgi:methylase of polypeptide subunit release factors